MRSDFHWSRRDFLRVTSSTAGSLPLLALPGIRSMLLTRPLRFAGKSLQINASTSSSGFIKVELCNEAGQPLPGFEAANGVALAGDEIAWTVKWESNPELSAHAGTPVRLRFILKEADLFAMQFQA